MLLYCSKCNNLLDKINDITFSQGDLIVKKCSRCGEELRFYVQYKAIVDKNWSKLTADNDYAIIG
jgi:RNase P subunit RPR2